MTYAVVSDVPASWELYQPLGSAVADPAALPELNGIAAIRGDGA